MILLYPQTATVDSLSKALVPQFFTIIKSTAEACNFIGEIFTYCLSVQKISSAKFWIKNKNKSEKVFAVSELRVVESLIIMHTDANYFSETTGNKCACHKNP